MEIIETVKKHKVAIIIVIAIIVIWYFFLRKKKPAAVVVPAPAKAESSFTFMKHKWIEPNTPVQLNCQDCFAKFNQKVANNKNKLFITAQGVELKNCLEKLATDSIHEAKH